MGERCPTMAALSIAAMVRVVMELADPIAVSSRRSHSVKRSTMIHSDAIGLDHRFRSCSHRHPPELTGR